jgi:predicted transcriptional regulator
MALKSAINVRLPKELRDRLDRIARAAKLSASDLIRLAVAEYCDSVEKRGTLTIPIALAAPTSQQEHP